VVGDCSDYHDALLHAVTQSEAEELELVRKYAFFLNFESDLDTSSDPIETYDPLSGGPHRSPESEDTRFIIAIKEFCALVAGLVAFSEILTDCLLVYTTDNKLVEGWLEGRDSNHPFAAYLIKLVAAIEASYHMRVFAGYVRTYHNTVADDCTRLDLDECALMHNLDFVDPPQWNLFLAKLWGHRALIWEGQSEADALSA